MTKAGHLTATDDHRHLDCLTTPNDPVEYTRVEVMLDAISGRCET